MSRTSRAPTSSGRHRTGARNSACRSRLYDIGYGHSSDDVAKVRPESPDLLTGYYDAVHEHTVSWVTSLNGAALDRVVDEGWNPPVTLGVRLVSVLSDDLQHAGQAAYVRGLLLG